VLAFVRKGEGEGESKRERERESVCLQEKVKVCV